MRQRAEHLLLDEAFQLSLELELQVGFDFGAQVVDAAARDPERRRERVVERRKHRSVHFLHVERELGALSGDRSLEFIYNATGGGASQALIGSQNGASGAQGLKVNQWNNTGMYGVTDFGVADHTSPVGSLLDQAVHIVFTSDGLDTIMYLNGAPSHTFGGVDLTITGSNAIGAAVNAAGVAYFDNLLGSVLGFASYDSALSPAEVSAHFNAFVVPEPASAGVIVASAGLLGLRRRRLA